MKNRLKQLREDRGWSQQQLAMKAGIGKTTVSAIEKGISLNPGVDIAIKLAHALDVFMEEIFYAFDDFKKMGVQRMEYKQMIIKMVSDMDDEVDQFILRVLYTMAVRYIRDKKKDA